MIATEVLVLDLLLTTTWILKLMNERVFQVPQAVLNSVVALALSFVLKQLASKVPSLDHEVARVTGLIDNFPELVLNYFLGFLLFATALHVDVREFRRIRVTVVALSVLSTLLSAFLVGALTYFVLHGIYPISLRESLLFGAIISPTDPVAVMSILKKHRRLVPDSTRFAILGESLFNDAISVILYVTLIGSGRSMEACPDCTLWLSIGRVLLFQALGGVLIGVVLGLLACYIVALVEDALLEVTTSVVLVLNLEVLCSYLDTSVPLATVFAGIVMSSRGRGVAFSRRGEKRLMHIWKFMDETLNGILFLLIGLAAVVWNPIPSWHGMLVVASATILITMLARAVSVALSLALVTVWDRSYFRLTGRHRHRTSYRLDSVAIIIWSGLRGGVSIALALAAPGALRAEGQEPTRAFGQLLFMLTYVGVVWSILVQGLLFGRVVRLVCGTSGAARAVPADENLAAGLGATSSSWETHDAELADGPLPEALEVPRNPDCATFWTQVVDQEPLFAPPDTRMDGIVSQRVEHLVENMTRQKDSPATERTQVHHYQTFMVSAREL